MFLNVHSVIHDYVTWNILNGRASEKNYYIQAVYPVKVWWV